MSWAVDAVDRRLTALASVALPSSKRTFPPLERVAEQSSAAVS
jgi:hypothetical protein